MELKLASSEPQQNNNTLTDQKVYLEALRLYNDVSNPENEFEAFRLFKQVAVAGYMPAQVALAQLYETGYGTEYEPKKAELWYKKAISQGSDDAMVGLAQLKIQGDIDKDYEGAKDLLEKAARMNNPDARALLEHLEENKPLKAKQIIAIILILLSIIPWAMFSIPLVMPMLASLGVGSIRVGFFIVIALAPASIMLYLVNNLMGD